MDSTEIQKYVFLYLTENSDEFISVIALYDKYMTANKQMLDKNVFTVVCETLNTQYNNIHKVYKNNLCYLCFLTDKSNLDNALNNIKSDRNIYNYQNIEHYSNLEMEFSKISKCEAIAYMIENKDESHYLNLDEYYDETDTVLHILARNGKYELIKKLTDNYTVNFDILNKNNETVMDVAKNDANFLKQLFALIEKYNYNIKLMNIRKHNTELVAANNRLAQTVFNVKKAFETQKEYITCRNKFEFSIVAIMSIAAGLLYYC